MDRSQLTENKAAGFGESGAASKINLKNENSVVAKTYASKLNRPLVHEILRFGIVAPGDILLITVRPGGPKWEEDPHETLCLKRTGGKIDELPETLAGARRDK